MRALREVTCLECGLAFNPWAGNVNQKYCTRTCRSRHKSRQLHPNLQEHYFHVIDTKDKAYWLGFLYADGGVQQQASGSYVLVVNLGIKDEDQLDRFIEDIGANPDKKFYPRPGVVGIRIGNQVFIEHLITQGCGLLKTFTVRLPKLNSHELDLAFLLGNFDGDGCFGKTSTSAILCSGTPVFLEDIRERFVAVSHIRKQVGNSFVVTILKPLHIEMLENYTSSMPRKRRKISNNFIASSVE